MLCFCGLHSEWPPLSLILASKENSFTETIVIYETMAVLKVSFTIILCQDKTEQ